MSILSKHFILKIMLEPSTKKNRSKNIPRMMDVKLLSSSSQKIKNCRCLFLAAFSTGDQKSHYRVMDEFLVFDDKFHD